MTETLPQTMLTDRFLKNTSLFLLAFMVVLFALSAMAGTNAAFSGAVTMITGWLAGSLGVLISLAVFTTGIMVTVTQHSLMPVAVAAAAALAISVGPAVLAGMFSATM